MVLNLKTVHVPGVLVDGLSAAVSEAGADWLAAVEFVRGETQKTAKVHAWELIQEMRNWKPEQWAAAGLTARKSELPNVADGVGDGPGAVCAGL